MFFVKKSLKANFISMSWLWLTNLTFSQSQQKHKTHDYSQLISGKDYVFEVINEGIEGQMTGVGKGIKPLDYILLKHKSEIYQYQVEAIDYYSDPPDMWIALLKPIKNK